MFSFCTKSIQKENKMSINLLIISNVKRVILSLAIGLLLIGAGTIAKAAPLAYDMEGGTNAFGTVQTA